jgi:hypothetical protein
VRSLPPFTLFCSSSSERSSRAASRRVAELTASLAYRVRAEEIEGVGGQEAKKVREYSESRYERSLLSLYISPL